MSLRFWRVGWLGVVVLATSCSRTDQPAPPARVAPQPAPLTVTNHPPSSASVPGPVSPEQLEVNYLQARDLAMKIDVLNELSDAEPATAVAVLSRLFFFEREPALQEEILNQLVYINGAEAAKIELLGEAVKTNQVASVRYAAIQVMVDGSDPSAVAVLQPLLHDADPGLREAAADAIEGLQAAK